MIDVQATVDLLSKGVEFSKNHMPLDRQIDPLLVAGASILGGLLLSFWGSRFLRMIFVLAAMGAGVAIGIEVARAPAVKIDPLIGLVIGAGLMAILGYLFFRLWVGIVAALCAVLLVTAVYGPRVLPAEIQRFEDQRLGPRGTDEYVLPDPRLEELSQLQEAQRCLIDMWAYFTQIRSDLVYRMGFALGLAWLIGLGIGLIFPRFTTIVGTSLIGSLGLGFGTAMLLSTYWPVAWSFLVTKGVWFLGTLGFFLVVALSYQARHGRSTVALPAPAAAQ